MIISSSQRFDRKKCQRELTIRWMGSKDSENWNGFNGLNEKSNI